MTNTQDYEKQRLLTLSEDRPDIQNAISKALNNIDKKGVVTSQIKRIETDYNSPEIAWRLSEYVRREYEDYGYDIAFVHQCTLLALKNDKREEATQAIEEYKAAEQTGKTTHDKRFGNSRTNIRFVQLEASLLKSKKLFDEALVKLEPFRGRSTFIDKEIREIEYLKSGVVTAQETRDTDADEALVLAKQHLRQNEPNKAYRALKPFLGKGFSKIDSFVSTFAHHVSSTVAKPSENERISVTISHSKVGNLNLGTIIGNVNSILVGLSDSEENAAFKQAIREIMEAVAQAEDLDDALKSEVVENLQFISNEATKPPQDQKKSIIRAILQGIGVSLNTAGSLASIWTAAGPRILSFFGL